MANFRFKYGPIKIWPASALRSPESFFRQDIPSSSNLLPINAAFYPPMSGGIYNTGYIPGYNGGVYDNYSMHYYGGPETANYGSGYRGYPQPSPPQPYRRSRTAPARTLPRNVPQPSSNYVRYRSPKGADSVDYRYFRSFSGPAKRPMPLYKKRRVSQGPTRQSNYQETEFIDRPSSYYYGGGGGGIAGPYSTEQPTPYPPQPQQQSAQTLRRSRPFYSPSYTTYPPSAMYPMGVPGYGVPPITDEEAKRRHINQKYPVFVRILLKIIQLIIAAAILGLVLGPMQNYSFHSFVTRTQTEWQGAVVGIVAVFGILTLLLLVTIYLASRQHFWRKLDTYVSCAGAFLYILVAFLESYFAACYPPNGKFHPEVCHRAEWIIACILAYFNIITYTADFILAFRTGVSML